jgi:NhaA family Na+:H+ antiporter
MLVPAGIYLALTHGNAAAVRGWAVPVATDIAFSLAVLRLLGDRATLSLRIFLTALAIIDDLGAIIVIAVFYSHSLAWPYLAAAMGVCMLLLLLRRVHVHNPLAYILCGCALWLLVFGSGVHATLSGVALAFLVPQSVAERLEAKLSSVVAYVVLPLFGLANAGLNFSHIDAAGLLSPAPLGVIFGLFFGKQIGVFGAAVLGRRLGLLTLPGEIGMRELYGCAVLCGIGFTMSLFIGDLAFHVSPIYNDVKLAVFCASLISAFVGASILARVKI